MTYDLSHLPVSVRPQAFGAAEDRIRQVHTAHWVGYPRADLFLEHFERLFRHPACTRMPCALLYGDSGIGKTMILEKFARAHRPVYDDKLGQEVRPVLLAQMPSGPDERRLYASLLAEIGAPFHTAERIATLETLTHVLLQRLRVRLVVIDEVHNLLAGSQREQRRALNVLKTLANVLQAVVVAVGTGDALLAIQTDAQVARRFEPLELPRWRESDAFRAFVATLLKVMPLLKLSPITDRDGIRLLLRKTDGITAQVCAIIAQSAEIAIVNGSESIDLGLLQHVSDRQHLQPH
jgi:Cdc6-like AAA superfamily ATPase